MGSDPLVLFLVIGAAAAVCAVGGYYLARYLKGSISISMPNTSLSPGGQAEGSFELLTRKEIQGNSLTAALVAVESVRERGYDGKSATRTREIFRAGQTLEPAKSYPAGYRASYNFKLPVPSRQGQTGGDSLLGQALNLLDSVGRSVHWKVEVRLDAEGVDLAASQSVTVNDPGLF